MTDTSKPHICFISTTLYNYLNPEEAKQAGGAQRQQYLLAKRLVKRGFPVTLVVGKYDKPTYERINGFDVWKSIPRADGPLKKIRKLVGLYSALRKVDVDMYYLRGTPSLFVASAFYLRATSQAHVYSLANDANIQTATQGRIGGIYVNCMRAADAILAQTNRQQQQLKERLDLASTLVPNGYDLPPSTDILDPEDREYILWVGRLDPEQKRPQRFLKLANSLPGTEFVLIGPPDTGEEKFAKKVEYKANQVPNLDFRGYINPNQIHKYYKHAIALVNTSEHEGFPNTFLEAWRYGTPVVTLHYTLDDIFSSANVGFHSGTMEQLEQDVETLVNNTTLQKQIGENARKLVQSRYSLSTVVGCLESIIFKINNRK